MQTESNDVEDITGTVMTTDEGDNLVEVEEGSFSSLFKGPVWDKFQKEQATARFINLSERMMKDGYLC